MAGPITSALRPAFALYDTMFAGAAAAALLGQEYCVDDPSLPPSSRLLIRHLSESVSGFALQFMVRRKDLSRRAAARLAQVVMARVIRDMVRPSVPEDDPTGVPVLNALDRICLALDMGSNMRPHQIMAGLCARKTETTLKTKQATVYAAFVAADAAYCNTVGMLTRSVRAVVEASGETTYIRRKPIYAATQARIADIVIEEIERA